MCCLKCKFIKLKAIGSQGDGVWDGEKGWEWGCVGEGGDMDVFLLPFFVISFK